MYSNTVTDYAAEAGTKCDELSVAIYVVQIEVLVSASPNLSTVVAFGCMLEPFILVTSRA